MSATGRSICLNMIVKNEAPVVRRCLESVRPIIDHWVIVDTGSTDGTQDIIRDYLGDLPGALHERPWRDFAHNRSEALELARGCGEYTLIIDADDTLMIAPDAPLPALTADSYTIKIHDGDFAYQRSQLVRNALPWRYDGVLHEYLTCDEAGPAEHLSAIWMKRNHDGARRKDPETYRRDAAVLEAALEKEDRPFSIARYRFYLAQSYRDCGEPEKALENYLVRAELGFWPEEVFISLYRAAQMREQLGHADDLVIGAYVRAADALPTRAEALHAASRFCRSRDRFEEGYQFAKRGLAIAMPSDGLFVEPWIYRYGLRDELAVHAYWSGRYQESLQACQQLLDPGEIPEDMRDRVTKNAEFAIEKIELATARSQPRIEPAAKTQTDWIPPAAAGGTELMVGRLRERMGEALDEINLQVNNPGPDRSDKRPRVVWMHHDVNQSFVQWCQDSEPVDTVSCFVFVSYWQRERYLNAFGLPPERCVVIKHALEPSPDTRIWQAGPPWLCAYASTPFRGLSVLLDAWERLSPANAELHVWSSMKLYLADDGPYEHLYKRARSMPGVTYHGIAPNDELRAALRRMHFLAYPCTFAETACLTVMEAMAAGCRVIVPSLGALPETTCGYARIYPSNPNNEAHAATFGETLAAELAAPWGGDPDMSIRQQAHCAAVYDWSPCLREWRNLVRRACDQADRR